jgi:hypothetical protein
MRQFTCSPVRIRRTYAVPISQLGLGCRGFVDPELQPHSVNARAREELQDGIRDPAQSPDDRFEDPGPRVMPSCARALLGQGFVEQRRHQIDRPMTMGSSGSRRDNETPALRGARRFASMFVGSAVLDGISVLAL